MPTNEPIELQSLACSHIKQKQKTYQLHKPSNMLLQRTFSHQIFIESNIISKTTETAMEMKWTIIYN